MCVLCGGGPVKKAFTTPAIHFKGSGWAKKERQASSGHSSRSQSRRRVGGQGWRGESAVAPRPRMADRPAGDGKDGGSGGSGAATADRHRPVTRRARRRGQAACRARLGRSIERIRRRRLDDDRHRPIGSRWPRPPRSSRPPTSTSSRRRSAVGPAPAGCRASSWGGGDSSGGARSRRSSPRRAGSGPRTCSLSCSRNGGADPHEDGSGRRP